MGTGKTGRDWHSHQECSVSSLTKGDCYAVLSAIVHHPTVVEVFAGFLTRNLDH